MKNATHTVGAKIMLTSTKVCPAPQCLRPRGAWMVCECVQHMCRVMTAHTHGLPKHKYLLDMRATFPPDGIYSTKLQIWFAVKAHNKSLWQKVIEF